ncbi:DUF1285 domain-containing protein [Chthonobacter rhizosphaerae]|uniref:DUF1285 domain-containing protein n=1 Tax=Chthonobacter rhizosphaerae TaxID=2735553 RepID=UPI0015EF82FD|nr:DUF1285 domain-containing protein [Chthonobacter rhizosphaerae]
MSDPRDLPKERGADGLAALIARAAPDGRKPPVERWNPPFCGDLDMEIDRDGRWHYMGSPIGREALVRLFASVLKREDDRYVLVTPVEKVGIRVLDAPFMAVEMHVDGAGEERRLTVRTNVGDLVEVGPDNRIRFVVDPATDGLKPYLHVRAGLEARFTRALTHDLAALLDTGSEGGPGVWAGGLFHPLPPDAGIDGADAGPAA